MRQVNMCIVDISDGEISSLETLSSLVSARMLSVALSVLHNRVLAEDAVQDAFVKIVDNASRFNAGTNGYAWICKITQNCALNILRHERRRQTTNIDDCFLPTPTIPLTEVTPPLRCKRHLRRLTKRKSASSTKSILWISPSATAQSRSACPSLRCSERWIAPKQR